MCIDFLIVLPVFITFAWVVTKTMYTIDSHSRAFFIIGIRVPYSEKLVSKHQVLG